jgi:xylulose-5-phosphate/fructose-6-phosphate phosphoketolase
VVGDGEAETGPLEGSWKGISFLNPVHDGAVLPILHLNGYKIAGPTVLGRSSDADIERLLSGHGYRVHFVSGSDPERVHADLDRTLEECFAGIRKIQDDAREAGFVNARPTWPAIVLRTPKGWTGPHEVDGKLVEGTFRSHQVPVADVRNNPEHLQILERWLRSYRPDELFDAHGALLPELAALAPRGQRRMSANPVANAGRLSVALHLRPLEEYALEVKQPGAALHESTRQLGLMLADLYRDNPKTFRLFCPDETNSNRLGAVFDDDDRCLVIAPQPGDEHVSPGGRVMEVLSEHNCQGWLEGYTLTGRHGLFATYEAFALIVASMATQHAKWLEACRDLPWRAPVPSLNYLLTSTCWRNDHNGFSHQGPGFMDTILSKQGSVARVYLPPDANCLLATAEHCLKSQDHVNLIIIDKQPQLQWLDLPAARAHCAAGASIWEWASSAPARSPDIVLACAGDTATLETLAAAAWLGKRAPELAVRVVNVVDLMTLPPSDRHPPGLSEERFEQLFTLDAHVVFAFHGYPGAVHQLLHGRPRPERFHVRGYRAEGTTTTPFDMVVQNETSRFHLATLALRHARHRPAYAEQLVQECGAALARHAEYVRACFEDLPDIRDFRWSAE